MSAVSEFSAHILSVGADCEDFVRNREIKRKRQTKDRCSFLPKVNER
jgi:hypothetical protein